MAEKNTISLKDKKVQAELAEKNGKLMTITGIYSGGNIISKLEGDALERDIDFQKNQMHRRYLKTEPYYKFNLSEVEQHLVDKDVAEAWLNQQIYRDSNGVKRITVETKNSFAIGYRKENGKIAPIKRDSLEGKAFAYGQKVTITFAVYVPRSTGEPTIGFENIFFDTKPKFYIPQSNKDLIGTNEVQGWELDPEDFSEEEGTVVPESAEADDGFDEPSEGSMSEETAKDDLWE